MTYDKKQHGKRLYHSKLIASGRIEEAAAYAIKANLQLVNAVAPIQAPGIGAAATAEGSEALPGGAGVQVAGGPSNCNSSTPKNKSMANTPLLDQELADESHGVSSVTKAPELTQKLPSFTFPSLGGGIWDAEVPFTANLERSGGEKAGVEAVVAPEVEKPVYFERLARERLPEGVKWGEVVLEPLNWMVKQVRFEDGSTGILNVTRRQSERAKGRMKGLTFACSRSEGMGLAGWKIWEGAGRE